MTGAAAAAVLVTTTVGTEEAARRLAGTLVEERLAACVQIQVIRSLYRWQGVLEDTPEFLLCAKTTAAAAGQIVARIEALHPYDVPEVLVTPVIGGATPYLAWLTGAVTPGAGAAPYSPPGALR